MKEFKNFKVIDLYPKITRGKRLTKADRVEGKTPLVTAGEEHYGIAEYIENHSILNKPNSLTIDMFGNVFYRGYEYFSDDNIISLYNVNFTKYVNLYIVGALQKIGQSYNYSNQFRMKSLEKTEISLPVTPEGTPDYAYMETYIKEMQREYIDSVLEANSIERNRLLSIVGLDQAEYERVKGNIALEDAESYGEFKVVNLYDDIQRGKRLTKADRVSGGIPLVTAGEEHYGIAEYIENHSVLNKRNSVTIDMFGNVFHRNYEYFSDDNIISLNNEKFTDNINIYIVGALQKIGQSYNYSNQFRMKSLETTKIRLPITETGEVDYLYMEDYISKTKLIYI